MRMTKEEFMKTFAPESSQSKIGGAMSKAKKKPRTDWTPELVEELKKAYSEKMSELEIAERLGVDVLAIKNKITRLGLRAPKVDSPTTASADAIYIKQLEELLAERTEELGSVKWELSAARDAKEQLKEELSDFKEKAARAVADTPGLGAMEEIYAIADCLRATNFDELANPKSVAYLADRIINAVGKEIRKRREGKVRDEND